MNKILNKVKINRCELRNRLVMPPMVIYEYNDENGYVHDLSVNHYQGYAASGVGMIVTEATAISREARLSHQQLAIWDDSFIEGQASIARAIKKEGAVAIMQIHHAGLKSVDRKSSPSLFIDGDCEVAALTVGEIDEISKQFIEGACRASKAGFDGIELHGAHGYLLSQFFSVDINQRTDQFGGTAQNRARLTTHIIKKLRKELPKTFIIGVRMGANDIDAINYATMLEAAGADYLSLSYGYSFDDPTKPEVFTSEAIHYAASLVTTAVSIPTIAVYKIATPDDAIYVIEKNYADLVAVGRSILVDNQWFKGALAGTKTGKCIHCHGCKWHQGLSNECPGRKLWRKELAAVS